MLLRIENLSFHTQEQWARITKSNTQKSKYSNTRAVFESKITKQKTYIEIGKINMQKYTHLSLYMQLCVRKIFT